MTKNDTRASLILRLPTASDAAAWEEFVELYEPLVFQFARRRGLQEADASELVQNVLVAVAQAVSKFEPDTNRGKFRTWLFRIARNQLIKLLNKRRPDAGSGRTSDMVRIYQHAGSLDETSELELDYRREVFRWAASRVRADVKEVTWRAFWMSSIEQKSTEEIAETLKISTGAVYIARCRVLARLRDLVREMEASDAL